MDLKISIAAVRVNAKLSQKELASEMDVTRETVCKWENGKSTPTKAQIHLLSEICNFPIENIFLPSNITEREAGNPKSNHGSSQPMKTAN
jgi:DNA-binding XRE family transcriptional regulator